jgi:hypothetical protein
VISLIAAALGAVTEGLKLISSKEATKYLDRAVELQLKIQKEENRGYDSDDARLESLYKEAKVILEAAQKEFTLALQRAASGK